MIPTETLTRLEAASPVSSFTFFKGTSEISAAERLEPAVLSVFHKFKKKSIQILILIKRAKNKLGSSQM